jgi:hypothetical protein
VPHKFQTIRNSIKSKCHCIGEITPQTIHATLLDWQKCSCICVSINSGYIEHFYSCVKAPIFPKAPDLWDTL